MTAKEYLMQARDIDKRIESLIEHGERLREKLTAGRMAQITGMPRGGRYDWADAAVALIELERRNNQEIMDLCRLKHEIWDAIDAVEEAKYRWLLELRYMNCWTWERIADVMGYEVRQVHRIHGDALQKVRVPDGRCH